MSTVLIASFGVLIFFLISQFGGKLTARNSLVWWFIFLFLGWGVVNPTSLEPVAHFLGIQLVSNFVLASMILFLAFQAIQESAFTTKQSRKFRDLVSSLASEAFAAKVNSNSLTKPKVLIGMPCYNEAAYLPTLLKDIANFKIENANAEFAYLFCIVNDGSIDPSRIILEQNAAELSTHHLSNVGVAGVLLTAFKAAKMIDAEYVVQCDSDGQHPLHLIPQLIAETKRLNADLLIGSRFAMAANHPNPKDESTTTTRRLGSRVIVWTLKLFFGHGDVTDPTSGFRVYSKKAQDDLFSAMPDEYPEPETIALFLGKKRVVKEMLVTMAPRTAGVSSLNGFAGFRFMIKVLSALIGLRLRTLVS